ncbi:triphosphoribosyl-dephospho-CoA synthase [Malonomonas rubra DSM 5091]|uniref:Probable 2-(5''-triphosphoribosyl)-3'-dephosphocoenzyme-A synthase n=2 Tax=Malonomonas rubra TaxID=57040 RepID=MDCB_MALRU|nr:triphosphoribosyl-dephospho-CoA synthase [Malonomonas rubra]O06922.1 RecName: Full=Probable 2-(5''-triphosphoribosyl)-3'-dephosphocoenzyme-A synthase; Short=2-(5''-triphosphoribosyl)-3'-dephospho-CoA synthase [Malonomonas rubra]AAC45398.1 MadG [Malonomonas rubra]SHJ97703.1 triphosphoribosyl-dephospho-CoA synthase [Malonomonas rubra DSM 5091]
MVARGNVVSIGQIAPKHSSEVSFSVDPVSWEIGSLLQRGMLLEVATSNKPGLVCPQSNGCHEDMSLMTFMVSSSVIFPALVMCTQAGRDHEGDLPLLLPVVRGIGAPYEKELFAATKGVNTQKGALFSAAILAGAAGYLSQKSRHFQIGELFEVVAAMTKGIVRRELNPSVLEKKESLSNGEKLYLRHQVPGIRGELERGLPSVRDYAVPALKYAQDLGASLEASFLHTLITLMSQVDDTNIISRGGLESLKKVKTLSKEVLKEGSIFNKEGIDNYFYLENFCIDRGLSPGGSADLLAITISAYLLSEEKFKCKIM